MSPGEREVAHLKWKCHAMESDNIRNMNECLITLFLATIADSYKKSTKSSLIGRVNITFQEIFSQFLTEYGKFTPIDLENNRQRLYNP